MATIADVLIRFSADTKAVNKQVKAVEKNGKRLGQWGKDTVLTAQRAALGFVGVALAVDGITEALGLSDTPIGQIISKVAGFASLAVPAIAAITAATQLWTIAQTALNVVMSLNPIILVVAAVAALIAIVVVAYQKVDWFRAAVDAAWQGIQTAWDAILGAVQGAFDWISSHWPLLLTILTGPIGAAVALIVTNWDTIKNAVMGVWNWISDNWPLLLAILTGPIGGAVLLITSNWDAIKNAAMTAFNWVRDNWPLLLAIITGPIGIAALTISRNWDSIKEGASAVYNWVADKFKAIGDAISGVVSGISDAVGKVVDAIKKPINALIRVWNGLEFRVPSVQLPSFSGLDVLGKTVIPGWTGPTIGGYTIGFPNLPSLAQGGMITSEGLVWAHPAEVIAPIDKVGMGPAVHIEHATFSSEVDVDLLMDRVAWAVRTRSA